MQDKYVIHTGEENQGLQNSFFAQTANLKQEELPLQGWKFHISASDISDYYNLYSIVVPELDKLGVAFKTVKPEKFQQQLNSAQLGKALTIYPGPGFDINKLSEKAKSFLLSDSREHIVPNGDMKIQGRIFARYGRFKKSLGEEFITSPEGQIEYDPKVYRQHKPQFMTNDTPDSILGFYSNIENKFNQTGDRKTYMQEYYTMSESDGKSHSYIMYEINPKDATAISSLLTLNHDPCSLSSVVKGIGDDKTYLMVHQTAISGIRSFMEKAVNQGVMEFKRPAWDIKINSYEIMPSQANLAQSIAQRVSNDYGKDFLKLTQTKNGTFIIKCDSSIENVFFDYCRNYNLAIRETQELRKSPLKTFYEKITGKDLDSKDITFGNPPISTKNYDNYEIDDR